MRRDKIKRYIFLDYEDLRRLDLKKLDKVCDKAFLFIDKDEKHIPFDVVKQLQYLGRAITWVQTDFGKEEHKNLLHTYISFWVGRLHETVAFDIEFAILSNEEVYDNLIALVNQEGRSCLLVRVSESHTDTHSESPQPQPQSQSATSFQVENNVLSNIQNPITTAEEPKADKVDDMALNLIRHLKKTGIRPNDLPALLNFIRVQNPPEISDVDAGEVITRLMQHHQIHLEEGEVLYNF